jgi:hypothetical protein
MREPFKSLERVQLTVPFGIRFRDTASGLFVSDGLNITVVPRSNREKRIDTIVNRVGIFVVNHLPRFREFESRAGDSDVWFPPPATEKFDVEIRDLEHRFQRFRLTVDLPSEGLYRWISPLSPSPPVPSRSVPLYSSASRQTPNGMAAIRADLWDATNDVVASWAIAEAYLNGKLLARGIAGADGRLALIFPYPSPQPFPVSSPIGSPVDSPLGDRVVARGLPLVEQVWQVQLRFLYSPASSVPSPPSPPAQLAREEELPDLVEMLKQQEARSFEDFAAGIQLREVRLRYGGELSLKSKDSISQPPATRTLHRSSVLFITPAV